jgi:hypothetical protein
MASERKPSIYSDRGTIGSSDELDEYGVWVKSEPQDLSSVSVDNQESSEPSVTAIEELPEFDTDFGGEDSPGFAEDDFEVPDLDIPGESASAADPGAGDSLDFDDLSIPEESPELPAAETGFTEVSMEDFLDGGSDLDEPAGRGGAADSGPKAPPAEKNTGRADLSTQLLMKIADELSSIRGELSTLKKEFSTIRKESPTGEEKSDAQKKGFFDEEEDEKIALTGDELDNILNTADFTEEAGADATEELPGVYPETEPMMPSDPFQAVDENALPDLLSDQGDIIGGESEAAPPEEDDQEEAPAELEYEDEVLDGENPEEDDIVIDLDFAGIDPDALPEGAPLGGEDSPGDNLMQELNEFDISLDSEEAGGGFNMPSTADGEAGEGFELAAEDSEELQQLREEGVKPMTPAPEDTSYLDEEAAGDTVEAMDELSLDDFSLDEPAVDESALDDTSLDLSDAVIDEPDLSGGITENPLEEPSLDNLSLDDEEEISISMDDEAGGEEVELSIPGEEAAVDMDIPEESSPGEEDFAQVIPEGFVVEADDSQGPLEDDLEEDVLSEGDIDTLEKSSAALDLDESAAGSAPKEEETLSDEGLDIPTDIKQELRTVLSYMDQLLESLPEDKIEEFAKSEYFDTYKKLFKELGLD